MKRNRVLIALTAFLLGVVSLLTFHLHYEGIKEVLSQFQKGQLSYAKHLSNQIQFYIQARIAGAESPRVISFSPIRHSRATEVRYRSLR